MTWLIGLVAATADAEAIAGDLDEERQALALRHGRPAASAWYWRQVVRTVAHLVVSPIRQAPFRFAALGVLGFGLIVPLTGVAVWVAGAIVLRVPVYHYIPATSFWFATSVVPHLLVGIVSGLVMGPRAMAAALAVVATMTVWVTVVDPILLVALLPPERLPGVGDFLVRAIRSLCIYGTSVMTGAALCTAMRRRILTLRQRRVTQAV